MSITGVADLASLVQDYTIDAGGGGTATVPGNRTLITTAPLTIDGGASADLSADRTFALTTSPTGQVPVGVTRLLTGTTPVKIDGAASGDFSADRTISVIPFTAALDGIVTHNAAGAQGKFLRDDNTFQVGAVSGVSDITATLPLVASVPTGSVVVSANQFGIVTSGIVPASGGGTLKFLRADQTWANPNATAVTLQPGMITTALGSTPDTGGARLSGNLVADHAGYFGYLGVTALAPNYNANLGVRQTSVAPGFIRDAYGSISFPFVDLVMMAYGTAAAPTHITAGAISMYEMQVTAPKLSDILANSGYAYRIRSTAVAGANLQPFDLGLRAGGDGTAATLDLISSGLIGANQPAPLSGFEVGTSFGLAVIAKTSSYVITAADCVILADATSAAVQLTLPTAIGIKGRQYTIVRVDANPALSVTVITTSAQTISLDTGISIRKQGESVVVESDGANWWITASNRTPLQSTQLADGAASANNVVNTVLGSGGITGLQAGGVFQVRASGKYSTTGTPTLVFQIKNGNSGVIADSGARTCPSGVTNAFWQIDCEFVVRSIAAGLATVRCTKGVMMLADGSNAITTFNMITAAPAATTPAQNDTLSVFAQWGTASASNTITQIEAAYYAIPNSVIS